METCQLDLQGIQLQVCDCPGENTACPRDDSTSAIILGKRHQFCTPVELNICEEGDVASEVFQNFRQEFFCVCPEHTRPRSAVRRHDQTTVQYTCETVSYNPTACPAEGLCAVREHGQTADGQLTSTFRTLCDCPERAVCRMMEESVIVKGRQEEHGYCVE
uniref:Uncharacterized protein n=1 Tax=Plectus sambesii TaxID=2011161 RepID=A0A914WDI1_9BILA